MRRKGRKLVVVPFPQILSQLNQSNRNRRIIVSIEKVIRWVGIVLGILAGGFVAKQTLIFSAMYFLSNIRMPDAFLEQGIVYAKILAFPLIAFLFVFFGINGVFRMLNKTISFVRSKCAQRNSLVENSRKTNDL